MALAHRLAVSLEANSELPELGLCVAFQTVKVYTVGAHSCGAGARCLRTIRRSVSSSVQHTIDAEHVSFCARLEQTTELGQDGLDLGSVFLYDLILLDLNLPDMSGFDVLRSLRLGRIKTPVVVIYVHRFAKGLKR